MGCGARFTAHDEQSPWSTRWEKEITMIRFKSARATAVWFALGLAGTLIVSLQLARGIESQIAQLFGM
jgi:hypothetical protein